MKKFIFGILTSSLVTQTLAAKEYLCLDLDTKTEAGKLMDVVIPSDKYGYGTMMYTKLRESNDGWMLTITGDGQLLNADPMVSHGRDFLVGTLRYENFYTLQVQISGNKMSCKQSK